MRNAATCRFHGGHMVQYNKSHMGTKHPAFKMGKYSKLLPKNIGETYERGLLDPHLLELREEVALVDGRLAQLAKRIGTNESDGVWFKIRDVWNDLTEAIKTSDEATYNNLLPIVGKLIRRGSTDAAQWKEIKELQDHRRKLSESEQKRMQLAQQMIAVESVMVLMSATIETLKESVMLYADQETATRILNDATTKYARLVGARTDGGRPFIEVQSDE